MLNLVGLRIKYCNTCKTFVHACHVASNQQNVFINIQLGTPGHQTVRSAWIATPPTHSFAGGAQSWGITKLFRADPPAECSPRVTAGQPASYHQLRNLTCKRPPGPSVPPLSAACMGGERINSAEASMEAQPFLQSWPVAPGPTPNPSSQPGGSSPPGKT